MLASITTPRSSKAKGWILVALALAIVATLFAVFDLGSQFRLRQAVQDLAATTYQNLARRPAPRPIYRHVEDDARGAQQTAR